MPEPSAPRVFVTRRIPPAGLDLIVQNCQAEVWQSPLPPPRDVLLDKAAGCHGLLTLLTDTVDAAVMEAAGPQLRVISNFAVGYNNIDVDEATRRNIRIGNTPDVLNDATADMAFALLIAAARRIGEAQQFVRAGRWKTWEPEGHVGQDLRNRTLGIVGMGRIGLCLATRCRGGWGMRVLYHDHQRNEVAERQLDARQVTFETLLAESDFVSVHADLNDTTRGLFGAEAFARMKPTAVFINTARGPIHRQQDLYRALDDGQIFAAGLDVTDPEPPAGDDPLLKLPNCIVVPHIASATVSSRNAMARIAAENLLAGLRGQPLPHGVHPPAP
jgi:glyoxylate reductase